MKTHIKIALVFLLSSFMLFSCSSDDSNPVDGDTGNKTTIQGRVTDNSGYGNGLQKISGSVEGATVSTAEIQADGSLKITSDASVTTNANGEFEIETNSVGKSGVVVVATKGSSEWKARISSQIESQKENYCPPLNSETSSEVDIYSEIVADGKTSTVGFQDVAFYVDAEIAAQLESNATTKTDVKNAIITKAEAHAKVLTDSHYGYSNTEYEKAKTVDEESQKEFERELYLSSDTEVSYNMAWENYYNAKVNGYSNTSIMMTDYAESQEVSGKAMIELNATLSSESRFQLKKRNAYLKAKLIAEAMIKEYEKAGASEQEKQHVADENDNLLLSIRNSTTVSTIDQAYADYKTAIQSDMKSTWSTMAATFAVLDSTLEVSAKATLVTTLSTASTVQGVINAYTAFHGSVETTVSSELNINDNSQIEAFTNIYALIIMHN